MNFIVNEQLISIREKCRNLKPLVVIHCLTYNHELYLRDALEGFVMQKTNFPFVAIVHEDASTDKTADILREYAEKYPDIILPIFEKENQYSKGDGSLSKIYNFALDASGAKYIAMCEGDDYWIDPLKLQKQVEFLESNPDYGMVYSKAKQYVQKSHSYINPLGRVYKDLQDLIVNHYQIPTASILYNKKIKDEAYQKFIGNKRWGIGDYPLSLAIASYSKIKFFPEEMSVYRILEISASHFTEYSKLKRMVDMTFDLRNHFIEVNNLPRIKSIIEKDYHQESFIYALKYNELNEAYDILKKVNPDSINLQIIKKLSVSKYIFNTIISIIKLIKPHFFN